MDWPSRSELEVTYKSMRQQAVRNALKEGLIAHHLKLAEQRNDSADPPLTVMMHPIADNIGLHEIKKCGMVCMFVDMTRSTERKSPHLNFWDFFVNQIYLYFITRIATCPGSGGKLAGYRGDGAFFVWFYKDKNGLPNYADFDDASLAMAKAVKCAANIRFSINTVLRTLLSQDSVDYETPKKYTDDLDVRIGIDAGDLILTRVGINIESSELTLIGKQADIAAKLASKSTIGEPTLTNYAKSLYPTTPWGTLEFTPKKIDLGGTGRHDIHDVHSLKERSALTLVVIIAKQIHGYYGGSKG